MFHSGFVLLGTDRLLYKNTFGGYSKLLSALLCSSVSFTVDL